MNDNERVRLHDEIGARGDALGMANKRIAELEKRLRVREFCEHGVHYNSPCEDCGAKVSRIAELERERDAAYLKGWERGVTDFAIWNDGVQHVGCMQTPLKEVLKRGPSG